MTITPSDTPRTDANEQSVMDNGYSNGGYTDSDFSRQMEIGLAAAMKELAAIRTQLHEAIELRDAAEYKALHREAMYEQRNELLRSLQAAAMAADARAERAEQQLAERDVAMLGLVAAKNEAEQIIEKQEEEIAALKELEKDAERYRFLRDVDPDAELPAASVHKMNDWGKWCYLHLGGDELDATIDAAMEADK